MLFLGRLEVKEIFPDLLSQRANEISLRPLSRRASERLIKEVLGQSIRPEEVARVVELAQGNALFLEELIRAAAEGKAGDVPDTVLAMLQARLSRLAPDARRVLRAASVLGETFWVGGVEALCEAHGGVWGVSRWLDTLTTTELVERRRQSRFPGEVEVGFRHALVRDAAYSLLTEADARAWHLAAGRWLERMGETDAMALAGHAEAGGDKERALAFYTAAAEQSLNQNDLREAIARAAKGIACGAEGQALGVLKGIQMMAWYGLGDWQTCGQIGVPAVEALPSGSLWWCRVAEKLFHVLPQIGEALRSEELSHEIMRVEPASEARSAYVCALCTLVMALAVMGARERGRRCVELLNRVGGEIFSRDPHTRGTAFLWQSFFIILLEPDPFRASSLAEQSVRDFEQGQVLLPLCIARSVSAFASLDLGDLASADRSSALALASATSLSGSMALTVAQTYRGFTLCERGGAGDFDEAARLAESALEVYVAPTFETSSRISMAKVALARGDWVKAEAEARRGREASATLMPVWALGATAPLIQALLRQGRTEEAAAVARDDLGVVARLGSGGIFEVPLRVAAAEAFFENGEKEAAERALREALNQIEVRAAGIPEAAVKDRYLQTRANLRAFELARDRLGQGSPASQRSDSAESRGERPEQAVGEAPSDEEKYKKH